MGFESEQVAGIDQYAEHGDRYERRAIEDLADLHGFLEGTVMMDFAVAGEERYGFIARTVKRFGYDHPTRPLCCVFRNGSAAIRASRLRV